MTHVRQTEAYKVSASAWLKRQDPTCHWCGRQTSTTLPRGHKLKATVDHLIEVDKDPKVALDRSLWVVACLSCNAKRGSRYRHRRRRGRAPSRMW